MVSVYLRAESQAYQPPAAIGGFYQVGMPRALYGVVLRVEVNVCQYGVSRIA